MLFIFPILILQFIPNKNYLEVFQLLEEYIICLMQNMSQMDTLMDTYLEAKEQPKISIIRKQELIFF